MDTTSQEWSNDELFLLIDLYRDKPRLWNPTHKEYKLKTRKVADWVGIAERLNCDVLTAKKKMESLLTSFRRERQRCEEGSKLGASPEEIYRSRWFAFEKMKFLLDKFTPRAKQSKVDSQNDNRIPTKANPSLAIKSPKKSITRQNVLPQTTDATNYILQDAFKGQHERDGSAIFGEHVAHKHRTYSARTKSIVEHLISNILFEADIGKYDDNRLNLNNFTTTSTSPMVPPHHSLQVYQHRTSSHSIDQAPTHNRSFSGSSYEDVEFSTTELPLLQPIRSRSRFEVALLDSDSNKSSNAFEKDEESPDKFQSNEILLVPKSE